MEKLAHVDLTGVELHETKPRQVESDASSLGISQEDNIETGHGRIHVCVQGERGKPAIFTYHDIGLNSTTCFEGFFSFDEMQVILERFTVYHINAPGQEENAASLPNHSGKNYVSNTVSQSESETLISSISHFEEGDPAARRASNPAVATVQPSQVNYVYPTMDQLADMLLPVMQYYGLKSFLGFGVGAGANILARFALRHPEKADALALVNCSSSTSSWTEWGFQKLNSWYLKSGVFSANTEEYLLWHYFGSKTLRENHDLVTVFDEYIKSMNPHNMGLFIESYIKRSDLGLVREIDHLKQKKVCNFRCPVMLVAGENSPHLEQVINMNSRLDPQNSTWMKFECGGMVHEEAPHQLTQAFHLFLQGMGYIPAISRTSLLARGSSMHVVHHKHTQAHQPKAPVATQVRTVNEAGTRA